MDKKLQKPLAKNAINHKLLKTILAFSANETEASELLTRELIKGENSSLIANFNPKNHLTQLHQSSHE